MHSTVQSVSEMLIKLDQSESPGRVELSKRAHTPTMLAGDITGLILRQAEVGANVGTSVRVGLSVGTLVGFAVGDIDVGPIHPAGGTPHWQIWFPNR